MKTHTRHPQCECTPHATATTKKSTKRFPGRPKGHKGATRQKPKAPDIIKEPQKKHTCDHCGAQLPEPIHVGHHIVEELPNRQTRQVIDFIEFEYKCTCCSGYFSVRHPDCPPEGIFGKNALIQTTLMKFEERLPFEKTASQMDSQFSLPMTPASAFDITRRVSQYLRPEYFAILASIRAARIVNVDETGVKVDGKRYWLWTFVTSKETLFVIYKSRGKKVLDEVLGKYFEGYLGCDGWKSYSNFTCKLERCWAYLLCEAEWLAQHYDEAKRLYHALQRLFVYLTDALVGDPPFEVR
jgi:transposase